MIDVTSVRADTPGCDSVVHLNNAGSALPPRPVVDAVVEYLRLEERIGGYEAQDHMAANLEGVYGLAASMLNCSPSEIAFTPNASDAWWRAFSSIPLEAGDRVLVGRSAFQANAFGLLQAKERGIRLEIMANDSDGELDLDALDQMLDDSVKLVCLTHISMSNGAIQPAAQVGLRAADVGAFYLLDACQSAGQLPLDVAELGCDFLSFTGRKFIRGPRGTGILFARNDVIDRLATSPFVDGRSAEWTGPSSYHLQDGAQRFEFGEQNFAGKAGLAVAIEYALNLGLAEIASRVADLSEQLRGQLSELPGVDVRDEGRKRSGIVTFTVADREPAAVKQYLNDLGINVSAPGRRNAQLDLGLRGIDAVVRAGVHYYNTTAELDRLVGAVAEM